MRSPAPFAIRPAISVVDLACGTGSTLRAIGRRLPPRQNWRLVDNNLSLLAQVAKPSGPPQLSVITRPVDLVRDLELALDGPLDLVTTSALLDLVSAEWLDRLIIEAAARRLPVYAALTYDGRAVARSGCGRSMSNSWPASTCTSAPTRGLARRSGRRAAARAVRAVRALRLLGRAGTLGLGVRAGRSDHSGNAVRRLGRAGER